MSQFSSLPEADEVIWVDGADAGVRLPIYRLAGPPGARAILFGHANGLAAGSYGPWLRSLAGDATVFAFDARGHGAAQWPEGPPGDRFVMDRFGADLERIAASVIARLDGAAPLYAGHSLGGSAALDLALSGRGPHWPALMLFEPPVLPARMTGVAGRENPFIANTAKRRADWPSIEAFFERLRATPTFARFDEAMLRAHCRATLRPAGDSYTLCCPPLVEAAIYRGNGSRAIWEGLPTLARHVDIVSGDPNLADHDVVTGAMAEVARQAADASLTVVEGAYHMMICERPEACRRLVLERLKQMP